MLKKHERAFVVLVSWQVEADRSLSTDGQHSETPPPFVENDVKTVNATTGKVILFSLRILNSVSNLQAL